MDPTSNRMTSEKGRQYQINLEVVHHHPIHGAATLTNTNKVSPLLSYIRTKRDTMSDGTVDEEGVAAT